MVELVEKAANSEKPGVSTGFRDLDELFHGFSDGDLIVLAARPGVGKTSLALNIAVNAAKLGASVAYFSLDRSADQLVRAILCSEARVRATYATAGIVTDADYSALVRASKELAELDLSITDNHHMTIEEIRAAARKVLARPQPFIVIDSLQLIEADKGSLKYQNRTYEVDRLVKDLKNFARECGVPVFATADLSRASVSRFDKRPVLTDLRESGMIEEMADIVMLLDRSMSEDESEYEGRPDFGLAEIIVAKHLNGPLRDITLAFNAECAKYMDFVDDRSANSWW